MHKIKLELDDIESFFLTEILSRALENRQMFLTVNEDNYESFDQSFHDEINGILDMVLTLRGLRNV